MAAAQNPARDNKRSFVRISTKLPVSYAIGAKPVFVDGEAINISKGGVFVCTREPLKVETLAAISIPVFSENRFFGDRRIAVRAEVVHARNEAKGNDGNPVGMGLRFFGFRESDWHTVLQTISRLLLAGDFDGVLKSGHQGVASEEEELKRIEEALPALRQEAALFLEDVRPGDDASVDEEEIEAEEQPEMIYHSCQPLGDASKRRRRDRVTAELLAKILTANGELFVRICDLSEAGVGFVSSHRMEEGEDLALVLEGGGMAPVFLRGRLVRRQPLFSLGRPQFRYSMAFSEHLEQYVQVLSSLLKTSKTGQ